MDGTTVKTEETESENEEIEDQTTLIPNEQGTSADASDENSSSDFSEDEDDNEAVKEAEQIVQALEIEIPEHMRELVIAPATNAIEAASNGQSPEKFLCAARKAIACMDKSDTPQKKIDMLSCLLCKIQGPRASGFLSKVHASLPNPDCKQKKHKCKGPTCKCPKPKCKQKNKEKKKCK